MLKVRTQIRSFCVIDLKDLHNVLINVNWVKRDNLIYYGVENLSICWDYHFEEGQVYDHLQILERRQHLVQTHNNEQIQHNVETD